MSDDKRDSFGIPRRICVDKLTPAEKAIYDAVAAVEAHDAWAALVRRAGVGT